MKLSPKTFLHPFLFTTLMFLIGITFGQVSILTSTTYTDNFNTFTGPVAGTAVSTLNSPTNWTLTATGNTWRGTTQTTGTSGGWYSNSNLSFLGSGTASNAQSTWILRNNSGNSITSFTIQFIGRLWKTGTASPNVTVSWINSSSSTNPTAGALTNSLSSCSFNDATTNISTGATISQTVSGLSIPNGDYIFIRFIHAGGSNSDNLGWDDVSFTPTITTPSTISSSGTLSSLSTTYGTASSTTSFTVSGANMSAGITITPPIGFEVSTSSTFSSSVGTPASPLVVGSSGTISSTTIYVRLSSTAPVGTTTYDSKNIVLSSTGASNLNVVTSTGNSVTPKTLTLSGVSVNNKQYDGTTSATLNGTLNGVVNSDVVSVTLSGTFSNANVGTGISVISTCTISGTGAGNYILTQPIGLSGNITKANQTITFNTLPYKTTTDPDFSPAFTSAVGLSITYTSSNPYVATIVGGQIHLVGTGFTTISANQPGDSNYNSAVQIQQTLYVYDLVSKWVFESVTTTNTGNTPTFGSSSQLADSGVVLTGTLVTGNHSNASTTWSNPTGNGSSKSISSNFWSVGDYFQFKINSSGYQDLKLVFEQTSSNTGPKDFKIQYSLDGTTFTDITSYVVPYNTSTNTGYGWSTTSVKQESVLSFDLASIYSINSQPSFYIRIVDNSTTAINGTTVGTGGTSRIDNFKILGILSTPLPIDLVSFVGKQENDIIKLDWTIASELNNDFFTVYKSIEDNVWEVIGTVDGSGNSNRFLSYSYIDENPHIGMNYYRLSQTDYNGMVQYKSIIGVLFEENLSTKFMVINNPSEQNLIIKFDNPYQTNVDVNIINSVGSLIHSENINLDKGLNTLILNKEFTPGIYLVSIIENGVVKNTGKFMVR